MTAVLVPGEEGQEPLFKHILINPTILERISSNGWALAEGEGCLLLTVRSPVHVPRHVLGSNYAGMTRRQRAR